MALDWARLARTDRLFFDYCLTHGRQAYEAEAPAPALLGRREAGSMLRAARTLYRALLRCAGEWPVPAFPLREAAAGGPGRVVPPFWARFDGFVRSDGGVFFAELNLDRPGGHREAMIGDEGFRHRFLGELRRYWERWGSFRGAPRAAFLIDPAHREELHIAHFYAGLLGDLGWPCTVVGPLNLSVSEGGVFAFNEPIDLLLRQFPTEFGHEVPAFEGLIHLHRQGRLLLLNDPAAVAGQAKTAFAWLWEQVLAGGGRLTRAEAAAVRETVPYTALMIRDTLPLDPADPAGPEGPVPLALLERPAAWVLKPVLGRYSQGVTAGALVSAEEWGMAVAAALAEPDYWVAQQYVEIAPQPLIRWHGEDREEISGYVNWGLHMLHGRPAGFMARCSRSPVTDDSWFAAVAIPNRAGEGDDGTLDSPGL